MAWPQREQGVPAYDISQLFVLLAIEASVELAVTDQAVIFFTDGLIVG